MIIVHGLRQWLFERLLVIMGIGGVGIFYVAGSMWYDNARFIALYLI